MVNRTHGSILPLRGPHMILQRVSWIHNVFGIETWSTHPSEFVTNERQIEAADTSKFGTMSFYTQNS